LNCHVQFIPFKIRDIRRGLYLHSVGVWTPTEKEPKPHPLTTCRSGSLLLNEDKKLQEGRGHYETT